MFTSPSASPIYTPPAPGLAARPENYEALVEQAASFTGRSGLCSAGVVGLVLRTIRTIEHPVLGLLPFGPLSLLALLVEYVYDKEGGGGRGPWQTGILKVFPGNRRLGKQLGVDERTIRNWLRQLEAHGWLLRTYNNANKRTDFGGIDLRPLAARIEELEIAKIDLDGRLSLLVAETRAERDDLEAIRALADLQYGPTSKSSCSDESGEAEQRVRQKSYNLNPALTSHCTNGASQVGGGGEAQARVHQSQYDEALADLMMQASPTLQRSVAGNGFAKVPPSELVRAVDHIVRTHFPGLRPGVYEHALKRHGTAAMAAVLVAADRISDASGNGIANRTAYLAKMLSSAALRATVMHNLRAMVFRCEDRTS